MARPDSADALPLIPTCRNKLRGMCGEGGKKVLGHLRSHSRGDFRKARWSGQRFGSSWARQIWRLFIRVPVRRSHLLCRYLDIYPSVLRLEDRGGGGGGGALPFLVLYAAWAGAAYMSIDLRDCRVGAPTPIGADAELTSHGITHLAQHRVSSALAALLVLAFLEENRWPGDAADDEINRSRRKPTSIREPIQSPHPSIIPISSPNLEILKVRGFGAFQTWFLIPLTSATTQSSRGRSLPRSHRQ